VPEIKTTKTINIFKATLCIFLLLIYKITLIHFDKPVILNCMLELFVWISLDITCIIHTYTEKSNSSSEF